MSAASYTYAIARCFDPSEVAGLRGVDGAPIHLVRHRDLVAVVSPLRAADAEESAWRARLEKMPELAAIARSHHTVVEAITTRSVTLPLRLATIHRGDDRVAQALRQGYEHFGEVLDRLTGRVELGVKVYVNPDAAPSSPREATVTSRLASPGKDYLRQRRRLRDEREDAWRQGTAIARQLDDAITALSVDRREHRTQSPQLSPVPGDNILNVAYLVDARRADRIAELARNPNGETHVRVVVTGPWAPYSFAIDDPPNREEPT